MQKCLQGWGFEWEERGGVNVQETMFQEMGCAWLKIVELKPLLICYHCNRRGHIKSFCDQGSVQRGTVVLAATSLAG